MEEMNPIPVEPVENPFPDGEKEVDLNLLFPGEQNDLNRLFPEAEMKDLLKKVSKNKKDLRLMVGRFTEISETD